SFRAQRSGDPESRANRAILYDPWIPDRASRVRNDEGGSGEIGRTEWLTPPPPYRARLQAVPPTQRVRPTAPSAVARRTFRKRAGSGRVFRPRGRDGGRAGGPSLPA